MNGDPTPLAEDTSNEPAFPWPTDAPPCGLTKRELIAAMALQGLLANYVTCAEFGFNDARGDFEQFAVARADALLKELAK